MLLVPRRRCVEAWSICIFTARTACEEHSVRCMHTSSSWSSMATGSSSCEVGMQRLVCLCLAFHNLATSRIVLRLWTYALRICDCLPITYTCACLLCPLFTCTCTAPQISQTSASRSPTVLAILTAYATLPGCIKAASTWQMQFPVTARYTETCGREQACIPKEIPRAELLSAESKEQWPACPSWVK